MPSWLPSVPSEWVLSGGDPTPEPTPPPRLYHSASGSPGKTLLSWGQGFPEPRLREKGNQEGKDELVAFVLVMSSGGRGEPILLVWRLGWGVGKGALRSNRCRVGGRWLVEVAIQRQHIPAGNLANRPLAALRGDQREVPGSQRAPLPKMLTFPSATGC